jgi:glyoxylase-like metal-dependent hydrolase (beta-lactamase superfamily II)
MSSQDYLVAPKSPPDLNIPSSPSKVSVKIIDSTTWLEVPLSDLMGPPIPGHDMLAVPAYSFLIEHDSGRKMLFDLGTRKDWKNFSPVIVKLITQPGWGIDVKKDVAEILEENGVDLKGIEAVVWSHWHYDHVGNMKTFPGSTKLIVGPGFKEAFLPAYPTKEDSPLLESDWEGRELVEVDFSNSKAKIGKFKCLDYFGDGSFYLLDAPGHAIGHICGLARVTAGGDDSFIFMGGDACHHGGEYRPTEYLPLPKNITPSPIKSKSVCPGSLFASVPNHQKPNKEFYQLAKNFSHDTDQANQTIHDLEEFDAAENVFVVIAHDPVMLQKEAEIDFFPNGTLNGWKANKLNEKARWLFLKDFAEAAAQGKTQGTEMEDGLVLKP